MDRIRVAVAGVLLMAGCAGQQTMYINPDADAAQVSQDKAKCEYEASAATQGTDYSYRDVFTQELDRTIRRNNLVILCMKSRGYVETIKPV